MRNDTFQALAAPQVRKVAKKESLRILESPVYIEDLRTVAGCSNFETEIHLLQQ